MKLEKLVATEALSLSVIPTHDMKAVSKEIAARLVRSYARGNVNLQYGRYVTAEELESRKQRLAQYIF